jgi:hypothetical protein
MPAKFSSEGEVQRGRRTDLLRAQRKAQATLDGDISDRQFVTAVNREVKRQTTVEAAGDAARRRRDAAAQRRGVLQRQALEMLSSAEARAGAGQRAKFQPATNENGGMESGTPVRRSPAPATPTAEGHGRTRPVYRQAVHTLPSPRAPIGASGAPLPTPVGRFSLPMANAAAVALRAAESSAARR